jgi:hypothetical protein
MEVSPRWLDLNELGEFDKETGALPAGTDLVGAWFSKTPVSANEFPELIMALEASPSASTIGTMDEIREQYLGGLEGTLPNLVVGKSQHYETPNGLEGDRTDCTFSMPDEGLSGTMAIAAVAHGRRFLLVFWISYDGPIDEQAFADLMETVRLDT